MAADDWAVVEKSEIGEWTVHSENAMFWGEVELEPEVRDWYLALEDKQRGRVDFRIDRLAREGIQRRLGMSKRTNWQDIRNKPHSEAAQRAYRDEASIGEFQDLVYRLRAEASLTQAELAARMGTTQSAIARMEGGGVRPTLDTLGRLATAVGQDLVVAVGNQLSENRWIAELVRDGRAVVRRAR